MADRFELVIDGKELANGLQRAQQPDEQRERFETEARAAAAGDLESHPADLAFIRALEYGLPRPRASASVSIGWSCCWARCPRSAT